MRLAALSLLVLFAGRLVAEEAHDWSETITDVMEHTARAEEGNAVLRVALQKLDQGKLVEYEDKDGATTYSIDGKMLPGGYWPGLMMIAKFEVEWDGKKIEIPERFWNDLPGFRLPVSSLDPGSLPPGQQYKALDFLESLQNPKVYVSADGGTLLIEWKRSEECDGRSTIRWIVSRSGNVMRHRHTPPRDC